MKIIIADDKEENLYLLEALLKGHGHEVTSVENGAQALDRLRSGAFDLIISDILMPVMDGFALCRSVKKDASLRHIPFIIYTATYTGPEDEAFAASIGADRFIQKPCEPDIFMNAVDEVMAAAKKRKVDSSLETVSEEAVLKVYNERLVRKLEHKMMQLESEIQARRQSETRYRKLYESMRDGFIFVDMKGFIRETNDACRSMLGYAVGEFESMTYLDLTPEKWHALEARIVREQVLPRGYSDVYEKECRRKDGVIFPVEIRTFLIQDDSGENQGMWAIVRDITFRKQAEKEKRQLQNQLIQAQKLEAVGRLAGGVAHDFNNILSVILSYGEMIQEDLPQGHPLMDPFREIYEAAGRAKTLTRQLLAFSRKQIMEMNTVDINKVVTGFERFLSRIIGEDVELKFILSGSVLPVRADTSQIEQVLMNLAVNARDAMPEGGMLTIETAAAELDEVYTGKKAGVMPGSYVMIVVSDTGSGMSSETLERLFEPFFTTKGPDQGTGLGLATSYGIIKQHGGHIWVYSEPGQGTTFKIYLPLRAEEETRPEAVAAVPEPVTGAVTVMVVEDDPMVRRLACRILEGAGYRVLIPENTDEAIHQAAGHSDPIHLVLADVIMPGLNGPELFARITEHHPQARALYMSGYTIEVISRLGVTDKDIRFIQKPFTLRGLLEKVAEVLKP